MTASPPGREPEEVGVDFGVSTSGLHSAKLTYILHLGGWRQKHVYYEVVANLFRHKLLLFQGLSGQGPQCYGSLLLNI